MKQTAVLSLLFVACGPAPTQQAGCDAIPTGQALDECLYNETLQTEASELSRVIEIATKIEDPIIRGAAVFRWIEAHNREVPPKEGQALCDVLSSSEIISCERRLYSAHLQR